MRPLQSRKSLSVNTVSPMTVAVAAKLLALMFWVNAGAGTVVVANKIVTKNCASDAPSASVPTWRPS